MAETRERLSEDERIKRLEGAFTEITTTVQTLNDSVNELKGSMSSIPQSFIAGLEGSSTGFIEGGLGTWRPSVVHVYFPAQVPALAPPPPPPPGPKRIDLGRIVTGLIDVYNLIVQCKNKPAFAKLCEVLKNDIAAQIAQRYGNLKVECKVDCDADEIRACTGKTINVDVTIKIVKNFLLGEKTLFTFGPFPFTVEFDDFNKAANLLKGQGEGGSGEGSGSMGPL